ncbi:MAG: hypothetical protein ACO34J_15610 [Prochlorothrix sp.]
MNLLKDSIQFSRDMASLNWKIQIWAALYPLPQLLGGIYFAREIPGFVILMGRILSFIIHSQVHRVKPFSKLIGPIGHAHWLLILPYLIYILILDPVREPFYWFIAYVVTLSSISMVIDLYEVIRYFERGDASYQRE